MPDKLSPDAQRIIGSADGTFVRGAIKPADVIAEGVAHALQLAGDELRLTTATPDQLTAALASRKAGSEAGTVTPASLAVPNGSIG